MIEAVVGGLDQGGGLARQLEGAGGGQPLVVDHPDGFSVFGLPDHGLDEVAALAAAAGAAVEPAGADQEMLLPNRFQQVLARQLGGAVDVERTGAVAFQVGPGGEAVEDVVGAVVHQDGIDVPGGQGQVPDGLSVGLKGGQDFGLAGVHLVEGRGVDHHPRPLRLQDPANLIGPEDVQGVARRGDQLVAGQGCDQVGSQLAGSSNQQDLQVSDSAAPGCASRPRPA